MYRDMERLDYEPYEYMDYEPMMHEPMMHEPMMHEPMMYEPMANSKRIIAHMGYDFTISLDEHSGTGHMWHATQIPKCIKLIHEHTHMMNHMPGAMRMRVFSFRPMMPCSTVVYFNLVSPTGKIVKTEMYHIEVVH